MEGWYMDGGKESVWMEVVFRKIKNPTIDGMSGMFSMDLILANRFKSIRFSTITINIIRM